MLSRKTIKGIPLYTFFTLIMTGSVFGQTYDSIVNNPYSEILRKKIMLAKIETYDYIIGNKLGEFSAKDLTGKEFSNSDLKRKITFINFWFAACAPCHKEFNKINELYAKYKSDSNVYIISFTTDNTETAKKAVEKYNLLYPVIPMSEEIRSKLMYPYKGFPCNYIVDNNGVIFFGHSGNDENEINPFNEIIIPKIDSLLLNIRSSKKMAKENDRF